MAVLDDPNREFTSSNMIKLEALPKPIYNKYSDEADFYTTFFDSVTRWAEINPVLIDAAIDEAISYGLSAIDALHVACAVSTGSDELVSAEKSTKPLYRSHSIPFRKIGS